MKRPIVGRRHSLWEKKGRPRRNILVLGRNRLAGAIRDAIEQRGHDVRTEPYPELVIESIDASTVALIIAPPLGGLPTDRVCARLVRLLAAERFPIHVTVSPEVPQRQIHAICSCGVAGVHRWPRERPALLAWADRTCGR